MMKKHALYTIFIAFISSLYLVLALHYTKFSFPKEVLAGSNVTLECLLSNDSETLHSLKWYKEGSELYRYTPSELTIYRVFANEDVETKVIA